MTGIDQRNVKRNDMAAWRLNMSDSLKVLPVRIYSGYFSLAVFLFLNIYSKAMLKHEHRGVHKYVVQCCSFVTMKHWE